MLIRIGAVECILASLALLLAVIVHMQQTSDKRYLNFSHKKSYNTRGLAFVRDFFADCDDPPSVHFSSHEMKSR